MKKVKIKPINDKIAEISDCREAGVQKKGGAKLGLGTYERRRRAAEQFGNTSISMIAGHVGIDASEEGILGSGSQDFTRNRERRVHVDARKVQCKLMASHATRHEAAQPTSKGKINGTEFHGVQGGSQPSLSVSTLALTHI